METGFQIIGSTVELVKKNGIFIGFRDDLIVPIHYIGHFCKIRKGYLYII